jgi:hypothetical protein
VVTELKTHPVQKTETEAETEAETETVTETTRTTWAVFKYHGIKTAPPRRKIK